MDNIVLWIPLLLTFLAGISTGAGSLLSLFIKDMKKGYLQFSLGLSAGVMVYISFVELLKTAVVNIGFLQANIGFFAGMAFIMLLDFIIPHKYIEESIKLEGSDKDLMKAGIFTAIGIAIHNLPEGIAVFMSAQVDIKIGIALALAIAIHNIPEGIAIAMPIFYATKSKRKAFWYSFVAGMAEPLGAVVCILVLMPFLNSYILSFSFAFVAGIMVFISFDELLPLSFKHEEPHLSILGIISGMLIMALSLWML